MNISPPEKPTGTLQPDANELVFNRASSMPTTPQPPVQHNIASAQRPNTHPIQPIRNLPQNNASIPTPRRSERILNRLGGHVLLVTITKDPQTVKEALNGQYAAEWTAAMKAEIDSLVANGTWILVDKPRGINLVTNKWVFRVKLNSKGEIDKFKARLVVRGFTQKYGVDFVDTYSPVIKQSTVRLLLFIALYLDIELIHGDIPAAYVKATMDRAIYMEIPHGIEGDPKTQALLLKKSLYGLKQSGRLWHTEIDTTLLSFGYRRSKLDPCLYHWSSNGKMSLCGLYVDDLLLLSTCPTFYESAMTTLKSRYDIKWLGPVKHCLGVNIHRNDSCYVLEQTRFIDELLETHKFNDCHPQSTPIATNHMYFENGPDSSLPTTLFREIVGSLQWLAGTTRPDIAFATNMIARHMHRPTVHHERGIKRILRYLKGTRHYGLKLSVSPGTQLVADAAFLRLEIVPSHGVQNSRVSLHYQPWRQS
ncbi:hypothetical protein AeRB84_017219 [Aphanomyces euteiches]|nr:hypothetical protein AeRB84_017219 [Aphanomyces euteiches]